jgi:hypothetical protein
VSTQPISDERFHVSDAWAERIVSGEYGGATWGEIKAACADLLEARAALVAVREANETFAALILDKYAEIKRLEEALVAVRAERDRLILAIRSHAPKQADAIIDVAAVSSPGEQDERANSHEQTINAWKSVSSPGEETP